jgi:hypothetical protein
VRGKIHLIRLLFLIFFLFIYNSADATLFRWLRVNKYQTRVFDSGDRSAAAGCRSLTYYDGFSDINILHWPQGLGFGTRDWTDENGTYWPYHVSGVSQVQNEEEDNIPVPDDEGIYIRRYFRYYPPSITVDNFPLAEAFPLEGDEVNPDAIPGTADIMLQSLIRLPVGVDIRQRVFVWSQKNHDDYTLFEWTFYNTGNVDLDEEIELPNQSLSDCYFLRTLVTRQSFHRPWNSCYGEYPEDSMRISYTYPSRLSGSAHDDIGIPDLSRGGFLQNPIYDGTATVHCDKSTNDHSDDPAQPQVTGSFWEEWPWYRQDATLNSPQDLIDEYTLMKYGLKPLNGTPYMVGVIDTTSQGDSTHHSVRRDEMGLEWSNEGLWAGWYCVDLLSFGPFDFAPGDSLRIVWADVAGTITPKTGWRVGKEWMNGTCTWDGPNNFPPPLILHPEHAPTENDKAKDHWVHTGKDSLFKNAWAAQWATRNNYNVPIPPPPPSIEIFSLPDKILVEWGDESEDASDFAGYRVYRAEGDIYYREEGATVLGDWNPIFECGEGTANSLTHSYEDTEAERGIAYYYYVAAFDDGVSNTPGVNDSSEVLESGKYLNMTTQAAYLTRPPGEELSEIRIVPNPYNIAAQELQYTGEPDKIMFLNLPGYCDINIYTESGDLVRTIEHRDGSGDEAWKTPTGSVFMTSSTGQIVVSGLYIAQIIETNGNGNPTGRSTNLTFLIIR